MLTVEEEALANRHGVMLAARLMDKKKPNWYKLIVYKRLDMQDGEHCIAGQSGFEWGELAKEFYAEHPEYGEFDSADIAPFADNACRDAWLEEIRARRAYGISTSE